MARELETASLREAIANTAAPSQEASDDYHIATAVNRAFLARARSGAPTLLVPLTSAPSVAGRRGGGFSLKPAARVAFDHDGRRWEQPAAAFECTESSLVDAFLVLAVDLGRRLGALPGEVGWQQIVAWVEEWQALLAQRPLMTTEQQLGLWGELWIIAHAPDPDSLIAAWRGPELASTDFFMNGLSVEVKVSRQAHVHHVSQRQAEAPTGTEAYLLSMWVGIDPGRGVSLPDLFDSVLTRVSDPPTFLKQVASLGYVPIDRGQYSTNWILRESPLWFRTEDVPRIRHMDEGISQVRFVVTLDADRSLSADAATGLWRDFCGGELDLVSPLPGRS